MYKILFIILFIKYYVNKMFSYFKNENFDIDTKDLIETYQNDDKIIKELIILVKKNVIKFPYKKYSIKNPRYIFENLKYINLSVSNEPYKLYSYFPKYYSFLPPLFRNKHVSIISSNELYETIDILSDYFIEDLRIRTKRHNEIYSVYESWNDEDFLYKIFNQVLNEKKINNKVIRDIISKNISENKVFNPTWSKSLLTIVLGGNLKNKKWLDISAGWGDRLITAMALDMEYHGYDPNIDLINGHQKMIDMFGDQNKHFIYYKPFEKSLLPQIKFDVILTSPPFFNLETYSDNQDEQSIINYPKFNDWVVKFLFTSLLKAWNNLKVGGYLILHIGDTRNLILAEPTNIFIQNFLPFASWEGVIGIKGMTGYNRPVWVWKKAETARSIIYWKSKFPLVLANTYTRLYKSFINLNNKNIIN